MIRRVWAAVRSEEAADELVTVMVEKAPLWVLVGFTATGIVLVAAIQIGRWVS